MSAPKRPRDVKASLPPSSSSLEFKYIIKSTVGFETVEAPPDSAFSAVVLKAQFVKENKAPDGWRWAFYCDGSVVPWDAPMESYGGVVIEAVLEDLQLFTIVPRQSGRMYKYEFLDKLLLLIKHPEQPPAPTMLCDYRTTFRALACLMQELDGQRRVAVVECGNVVSPYLLVDDASTIAEFCERYCEVGIDIGQVVAGLLEEYTTFATFAKQCAKQREDVVDTLNPLGFSKPSARRFIALVNAPSRTNHTIIVAYPANEYACYVKAYDEGSERERWYKLTRDGLQPARRHTNSDWKPTPEIILWCAVKAARSRLLRESIGQAPEYCDVTELLLALTMYAANRHGADLTVCYRQDKDPLRVSYQGGSWGGRDVMQDVRTGFPDNAYFLVNNRLLRPREFVKRAAAVKFQDAFHDQGSQPAAGP